MVYYIRFLKTPQIYQKKKENPLIKIAVAVTTDLGDAFFPGKLLLGYEILAVGDRIVNKDIDGIHCSESTMCLRVEIPVERSHCLKPLRMHVFPKSINGAEDIQLGDIPPIVDIWSDSFMLSDRDTSSWRVERRLALGNIPPLRIWEDVGDSIARHIW